MAKKKSKKKVNDNECPVITQLMREIKMILDRIDKKMKKNEEIKRTNN